MRYDLLKLCAVPALALALLLGVTCERSVAADAAALAGASKGPLIERYGPVYDIPKPGFETPTRLIYKAVFDVAPSPEDPGQVNSRIESLARFLNMQARAGVPSSNMHLALVLHGPAGKDALSASAYKARFGVENPNAPLIEELRARGVKVILCGQTAAYKGFADEELASGVELSISAMTALIALQADGYGLIAF